MAMDVGRIFFEEMNVVAYNQLGIGRLIYQLPIPLCKMFIREIFSGRGPEEFDEETGSLPLGEGVVALGKVVEYPFDIFSVIDMECVVEH